MIKEDGFLDSEDDSEGPEPENRDVSQIPDDEFIYNAYKLKTDVREEKVVMSAKRLKLANCVDARAYNALYGKPKQKKKITAGKDAPRPKFWTSLERKDPKKKILLMSSIH